MNIRTVYEHLEREVDGSYYWWINKDAVYLNRFGCKDSILNDIVLWFYKKEAEILSLYYKGTRLYFTYNSIKYFLSWVFYSRKLIDDTIIKLKDIGANNIQINYGELD